MASADTDDPLSEAVTEHRDSIEAWAASDLPLAEEMAELLAESDGPLAPVARGLINTDGDDDQDFE